MEVWSLCNDQSMIMTPTIYSLNLGANIISRKERKDTNFSLLFNLDMLVWAEEIEGKEEEFNFEERSIICWNFYKINKSDLAHQY